MSCKSAIYLVNSGSNAVAEGNSIPTGNVIRRFGQNIFQSGSGVVANGNGYYEVEATFTVVPSAMGVVGVAVVGNGSEVSGVSQQFAGTADEPVNLSVVCLVRNCCGDCARMFLEFVLENGSGTVTESNIVVKKI